MSKIGKQILKFLEKAMIYLDLFQNVPLIVSVEFNPFLKPLVQGLKTFGDLSKKFITKEFYISLSKFLKHFFTDFNFETLRLITKLAVLVLSSQTRQRSQSFDNPKTHKLKKSPIYIFRKFLENLAEYVLIKTLQKNVNYLGMLDCLEYLLTVDVRCFGIKKLMRVLSKLCIIKKQNILGKNPIIDHYIKKMLKVILVFTEKTKIFPDLSNDSIIYLKNNFRSYFYIFERFLIRLACNVNQELQTKSNSGNDLEENMVIKVFGTDALFYKDNKDHYFVIDCLGEQQLLFSVESQARENRDCLEKSFNHIKSDTPKVCVFGFI
jgi:hypothetical protein